MRVGVLSPTTWQQVEKMASLFPEGIEVAGPLSDDGHYWNDYRRKMSEWEDLGLRISLNLVSYDEIDFSAFDVLIEFVETFFYTKSWAEHCSRLECPILVRACWTKDPRNQLPPRYMEKIKDFPVLLEMPSHAEIWKSAGFNDLNVLFNPVGEWWFKNDRIGEKERGLFVLSGTNAWRASPSCHGLEIWENLCRAFPGKMHHHDGHQTYKTSREMVKLFTESRVFVNLDRPYGEGERPLTLAFAEALSAGLPVVARDLPGLDYKQFIDTNGMYTNDFESMRSFIEKCLQNVEYAITCGNRSREIARQTFSYEGLKPKYQAVIKRAQDVFERTR